MSLPTITRRTRCPSDTVFGPVRPHGGPAGLASRESGPIIEVCPLHGGPMPYHWWRNPRQAFARLSCLIAALVPLRVAAQGPDWKAAQDALGRPGAVLAGNVLRVGFPRTDLRVSVGKVRLLPALALGSWVAFAPAPDGALMMGDLVLTEGELQPVMARLLSGGIRVTGIHHHLVGDRPEIFYVHVHARGEPGAMARAIQAALALTGTPPPGRRVVPRRSEEHTSELQ